MKKYRIAIVSATVVLVGIVGLIDYVTGYELGFSLFYLLPVYLASVFVGWEYGMVVGIASAVVWTESNLSAGMPYSHVTILWWNIVIRSILLGIFAATMARLRISLQREKTFARKDFLTGMPNSQAFYEIASREVKRSRRYGKPLSLAYLDCDNFKMINDTFGHAKGNEFLASVGRDIAGNIRDIDMPARVGGDEFVILLPDTSAPQARVALERLRAIFAKSARGYSFPVTFSIGLATFLKPADNLDELIAKADALMYDAKKRGKNIIQQAEFAD